MTQGAALLLFHPLEHRLDRVLQQVGQGLGDLLGITIQLNVSRGKACFEPNAGARALLKVNGLAHQILPRSVGENRRRHPGEGGELVDQAADAVDLADDRIRAVGERTPPGRP